MMKKRKKSTGVWLLVTVMTVILLFTYLSLNLKSVDFGYEIQDLRQKERALKEEINRLKAEKASLLNLERVERIVTHELGYQYPEPHQFLKVFEDAGSGRPAGGEKP